MSIEIKTHDTPGYFKTIITPDDEYTYFILTGASGGVIVTRFINNIHNILNYNNGSWIDEFSTLEEIEEYLSDKLYSVQEVEKSTSLILPDIQTLAKESNRILSYMFTITKTEFNHIDVSGIKAGYFTNEDMEQGKYKPDCIYEYISPDKQEITIYALDKKTVSLCRDSILYGMNMIYDWDSIINKKNNRDESDDNL